MALLFGAEDFATSPGAFDAVEVTFGAGTVSLDTTSKVNGANSIKFANTGEAGERAIENLGAGYADIYFQLKGFLPSGFAFGVSGYSGFLLALSSLDVELFAGNIEDYGTIRFTMNNPTSGYLDTGVDIPINSVFTLEVRMKISATVGNVSVWLNNTVEGSPDYNSGNINTGVVNVQKGLFGKTYVPEAVSDFYLDFISMDNAFIGARSSSTTAIKTVNGLAKASVKTVNGLVIASVKTINGLT